ncbi:uncharacterized protein LOC144104929 [Amblyomma americanum]
MASQPPSECQRASSSEDDVALRPSMRGTPDLRSDESNANPHLSLAAGGRNVDRLTEIVDVEEQCKRELWKELLMGIESVKKTVSEVDQAVKAIDDNQRKLSEDTRENLTSISGKMERVHHDVFLVSGVLENYIENQAREQLEKVNQIAADIAELKTDAKECFETMNKVTELKEAAQKDEAVHRFVIKGVKFLRDDAIRRGEAEYDGDKAYLRGYYMSPGVTLKKKDNGIVLHARFYMHKGAKDNVLAWPFRKTIVLRVMHPARREDQELKEFVRGNHISCRRPEASDAPLVAFCSEKSLSLDVLITEGYVEQDQLRVEFEVLH